MAPSDGQNMRKLIFWLNDQCRRFLQISFLLGIVCGRLGDRRCEDSELEHGRLIGWCVCCRKWLLAILQEVCGSFCQMSCLLFQQVLQLCCFHPSSLPQEVQRPMPWALQGSIRCGLYRITEFLRYTFDDFWNLEVFQASETNQGHSAVFGQDTRFYFLNSCLSTIRGGVIVTSPCFNIVA